MRLSGLSLAARLVVVAAGSCSSFSLAQEVRPYRENGVDYVETVQYVSEPVATTQVDRREETVYREELVTEMRESQHTVYSPVTEYVWQPRVHGLGIIRPSTVAYHLVPQTRWEPRTHTVRTPVTVRQMRPETRVVEVPRRELGFAQRQDVSRTALAPTSTPRVASRPSGSTIVIPPAAIGGLRQLDGDHPRFGLQPGIAGGRY
jgi:hypothetical protein